METHKLTIRKIGNSLGLILPKEAAQAIDAHEGDTLTLTKDNNGEIRLTSFDPEFDRKMEIARSLMGRYKNTLRELAR